MKQLLSMKEEDLNSCIFTSRKEIALCQNIDQLQAYLKEQEALGQEDLKESVLFFEAKVVVLSKGKDKKSAELMLEIRNVSWRIQGEALELERKYLSQISSTSSHEMRNPLNAILSQVIYIRDGVGKMEVIYTEMKLRGAMTPKEELDVQAILDGSKKSLKILESSSKILEFSVEDMLALPRLK